MFQLIQLPYAAEALSPVISSETLALHHGKHLQTYVDNLNKMIAGTEYEAMSLEQIICKSEGGIFNNAGQIFNHNQYFMQFAPAKADNRPVGALAAAIDKQFGSFEALREQFEQKAVSLFGSGWVWLSADASGALVITQETNAGTPLTRGLRPLLTFDVWEHAYYVDYRNRRAEYVKALWPLINWQEVDARFSR